MPGAKLAGRCRRWAAAALSASAVALTVTLTVGAAPSGAAPLNGSSRMAAPVTSTAPTTSTTSTTSTITTVPTTTATEVSQAYLVITAGGSIIPFGDAGNFGSLTTPAPSSVTSHRTSTSAQGPSPSPVVGAAATADAKGYWLLTAAGAVDAYGDAKSYGSLNSVSHAGSAVALLPTSDAKGYLVVTSAGAVFAFGDASYLGSANTINLVRPIVSASSTHDGKGYWLVASDGGVFAYGDAGFYGSTGNIVLNQPIVGMSATSDSKGYWMVASDGGVFAYGDSGFYGSTGAESLVAPIRAMSATSDSKGYWMVASDGGIFAYGDAAFSGSAAGHITTGDSVVSVVATKPYIDGGSAIAKSAVTFALSQVGIPYLYGGTGPPGGYDCSGLVMVSYQTAGLTLPRTAQEQYDATIPVPPGVALLPGDLVFFGTSTSAVSHDGIYIGNGEMVDAPHTGADVRVEDDNWSDYVGATRPAP